MTHSAAISKSVFTSPTMTSLELVDFINAQKREDEPETRHRDFCEKARKVLGIGVCEIFRVPYTHQQNCREYAMLALPKREACLMAMSYSYELQAKVFDRMTELENSIAVPLSDAERLLLTARSLVALERNQEAIQQQVNLQGQQLQQIAAGAIPSGWQTVRNLSATCGLSPDKTRQFIKAFGVPSKKIPHVGPGGTLSHATVADEADFLKQFAELKRTAKKPVRGHFWIHPKMGSFSLREVE